jgi:sec-independent protein translocase protein TatA
MVTTVPLQIPGVPGGPELLIILLIAVLLFGANKIPKLARSSGEAIGEFQKGRQEVEEELQDMKEGGSDSSDEEGEDTLDLEEESASSTSSSGS